MSRLPTRLISRFFILALALLVSIAEPTSARSQALALASPPPETTTTDAQVAAAVLASATVNISLGSLALKSSSDPAVRRFAEELVTENATLVRETLELSKQLAIVPEENLVGTSLHARGRQGVDSVLAGGTAGSDRRFVTASLANQQALIQTLDGFLLPNVRQPRLKDLLVNVRSATERHLDEAHRVESMLVG